MIESLVMCYLTKIMELKYQLIIIGEIRKIKSCSFYFFVSKEFSFIDSMKDYFISHILDKMKGNKNDWIFGNELLNQDHGVEISVDHHWINKDDQELFILFFCK